MTIVEEKVSELLIDSGYSNVDVAALCDTTAQTIANCKVKKCHIKTNTAEKILKTFGYKLSVERAEE